MSNEPDPFILTPTGYDFWHRKANFKLAIGPFGTGKTRLCVEYIKEIMAQAPAYRSPTGRMIRKTRGGFVRGTFRRLKRTILKDMNEWFPEGSVSITKQPPHEGEIVFGAPDGSECVCELTAMAGEDDKFIDDFTSTAFSWMYYMEIQEMQKWEDVSVGLDRTGRYKPVGAEPHPFGKCVIGCGNYRDVDHWMHNRFFTGKSPANHAIFRYPAPMNFYPSDALHLIPAHDLRLAAAVFKVRSFNELPLMEFRGEHGYWIPSHLAENINNLDTHNTMVMPTTGEIITMDKGLEGFAYYWDMITRGEDDDYLTRHLIGDEAATKTGKPVYPKFNQRHHVAPQHMNPDRGQIVCATDPGWSKMGWVIAQMDPSGRLCFLEELLAQDMTQEDFRDQIVIPTLRQKYGQNIEHMVVLNDPTGDRVSRDTGRTWADVLAEVGIASQPAPGFERKAREAAVNHYLTKHDAVWFNPSMETTVRGMQGAYIYPKKKGSDQVSTQPDKDSRYSEPIDCVEMICMHFRQLQDSNFVQNHRRGYNSQSPDGRATWYG